MTRRSGLLLSAVGFALLPSAAFAQGEPLKFGAAEKPLTASAAFDPADARAGEQARILVHVKLLPTWHIYSAYADENLSIPTTIKLGETKALKTSGKVVEPAPQKIPDPNGSLLDQFGDEATFALPVQLSGTATGKQTVTISMRYQACDASKCLLPKTETLTVQFEVAPGAARPDRQAVLSAAPPQPAGYHPPGAAPNSTDTKPDGSAPSNGSVGNTVIPRSSLLIYLWACFAGGLVALLTPCVFPMIPITVSFFAKRKQATGASSHSSALVYCLGIIGTYTLVGLLVSIFFGASSVLKFAANAWVNIGLSVVFVVLAASLFGAFELVAPQWLVSKASSGTGKAGFAGPLFMAITFTLTSFTCTVPVAGAILASSARGDYLYPVLGMLSFSIAFASPFYFLARFPQYLEKLPKSGSWLTSVKAFMGFVELAFALKFISNVDLVWQAKIITRPVFLSIWAALGVMAGLYLWGWLRLPHDDQGTKIGWFRRLMALTSAAAGIYCLAAIEGASLGQLEAFPPPDGYTRIAGGGGGAHSIPWRRDYKTALAEAKQSGKALFVNFTGWTCVNCRAMEKNILPSAPVAAELANLIPVELYTDRDNPAERANQELMVRLTQSAALPIYVVMTPEEKVVKTFAGGTTDAKAFANFIRSGFDEISRMASR